MSNNELTLTLVGWVATAPKLYTEANKTPYVTFRMAANRRHLDRETGNWVDGRTEWFTIKAWRQLAINAAESVRKSDPVIVHGRLSTEEWIGPDGPRMGLVLEADAIGPDLNLGQARFARTEYRTGAAELSASIAADDAAERDAGDQAPEDPWATGGSAPDAFDGEGLDDELDAEAVGSAR